MGEPIGKWDQALFEEFKRARPGRQKEALRGKLLVQNAPLIKILLDQFIQPSGKCKHGPNMMKGGTQGFTDIPWEDGYQLASIAFCKAMDRFDPTRKTRHGKPAKLPWYLKLKIRHELQTLVASGGRTVRVPRGHEAEVVGVDLIGEQEVLDRLGGSVDDGIAELEGITPEDVRMWQKTGRWPTREEWEDELARRKTPDTVSAFLQQKCVVQPKARIQRGLVGSAYEAFAEESGFRVLPRGELYQQLAARGHVETRARCGGQPVRAVLGLRLRGVASGEQRPPVVHSPMPADYVSFIAEWIAKDSAFASSRVG